MEAGHVLVLPADVIARDHKFPTNQFQGKVFRIESLHVDGELISVFVISCHQSVWNYLMASPRKVDSGKVQIMVVEELKIKRVVIEGVPADKVEKVPPMPQSETT